MRGIETMNNINALMLFIYNNLFIISFIVISVSIFIIVLLFFSRRKLEGVSRQLRLYNDVFVGLTTEQGLEKHLNHYLNVILPIVEVSGYYFYLRDSKSGNFVLRVNRQVDPSLNSTAPSNGSVKPKNKEKYNPPLGFPGTVDGEGVSLIKDGEVPLVQLTIKGGQGIIRLGPLRRLTRQEEATLEMVGKTLYPALTILLAIEKQKNDAELVVATGKVINGLAKSIFDVESLSSKMMMLGAKMINADACCLIMNHNSGLKLHFINGFNREIESQLRNDNNGMRRLYDLIGGQESNHISRNTKDYATGPDYIGNADFQSLYLIKVDGLTHNGVAVFWHHQIPVVERHQISTVKMLLTRLGELFEQQTTYKELTDSYIGALRILVEATDNLEPTTVGHSELIANYSMLIAKQLKLPEQEVQDIKMAGYFHDIGMIGLSNDILFKPGKYSDLEFETMKLHAEVGAAIGESTIANSKVASYIRHHHERWDGYGYPLGLQGEEIPLGARIIAVADTFNAKLGGRKYREPASFEQAVSDLKTSAGTQLDPVVVQALLEWFLSKQVGLDRDGRSLGPCWAMRCSPSSICKQCVAFNRTDKNCWEFQGVNCQAHGNSCTSCFIHSEAIYRAERNLAPFIISSM